MRKPLEARRVRSPAGIAENRYDEGRQAACRALLAGPVRAGAARRLVELVLLPREHPDELHEIFDEIDELAQAPRLDELTAVAARATAAHTCRGTRSLTASVAAISAGIDRRFAACESGEAGYPLSLEGLGGAGRYGLDNKLSRVYLTHTLERIVESALFVGTVVEPNCAPGAYAVTIEPRRSTTASVGSLLASHLARDQNATIDFALEELTSRYRREPAPADHLQTLLLALRAPIDVGQLVVGAHALVSAVCDDVEIHAELAAAAGILDGSGLTAEGSLALGEAVGALTGLAAGLVSWLPGAGRGAGGAGGGAVGGGVGADELARSALRMALVVAWCAHHGRVRPGAIAIDDRRGTGG
ncbi:MAG TPA: hypothetical protein VIJ51_03130 [Solirubrobacteraceae bacterium]